MCNISYECAVFQLHGMGLVVVQESKVVGLYCSGAELHAGQAAIIQQGARLADCQLYFSRRPCATCLKMIINGEEMRRPKNTQDERASLSVIQKQEVLDQWELDALD